MFSLTIHDATLSHYIKSAASYSSVLIKIHCLHYVLLQYESPLRSQREDLQHAEPHRRQIKVEHIESIRWTVKMNRRREHWTSEQSQTMSQLRSFPVQHFLHGDRNFPPPFWIMRRQIPLTITLLCLFFVPFSASSWPFQREGRPFSIL